KDRQKQKRQTKAARFFRFGFILGGVLGGIPGGRGGVTKPLARHAVNPSMGAQHRHPVGDGLASGFATPRSWEEDSGYRWVGTAGIGQQGGGPSPAGMRVLSLQGRIHGVSHTLLPDSCPPWNPHHPNPTNPKTHLRHTSYNPLLSIKNRVIV